MLGKPGRYPKLNNDIITNKSASLGRLGQKDKGEFKCIHDEAFMFPKNYQDLLAIIQICVPTKV